MRSGLNGASKPRNPYLAREAPSFTKPQPSKFTGGCFGDVRRTGRGVLPAEKEASIGGKRRTLRAWAKPPRRSVVTRS